MSVIEEALLMQRLDNYPLPEPRQANKSGKAQQAG